MPCLRLGLLFDLTPGPGASCVFLPGRIESLMACCEPDNVLPPRRASPPEPGPSLRPHAYVPTHTMDQPCPIGVNGASATQTSSANQCCPLSGLYELCKIQTSKQTQKTTVV